MIIYLIRNKINGKCYIGFDRHKSNKRWKDHVRRSRKDKPIQLIDRKIKQYGVENFEYMVLCECSDISELKKKEIYYIKRLNSYIGNGAGYNLTLGGNGCFGFRMPEEKINKGEKHYMFGKERTTEDKKQRSEAMKKVRTKTTNPFTLPKVKEKISECAKKRTGKSNPNYRHGRRAGGRFDAEYWHKYYLKNKEKIKANAKKRYYENKI